MSTTNNRNERISQPNVTQQVKFVSINSFCNLLKYRRIEKKTSFLFIHFGETHFQSKFM